MKLKIISIIICVLLTGFASCSKSVKRTATYFGGKIINPKANHVILYSMDKVIDTFFINAENKFIGKLEDVKEGLYYFVHGYENQFVYLEPNDSLMLSLNTWNFDESLVFSGFGADRNNILLDCYLQFEKDERLFYQYNALPPKLFQQKVDSIIRHKIETFEDYALHHPKETASYYELLKTALTYPVYTRIENYPNAHAKKMHLSSFPKTPISFYDFRKDIDLNKDAWMYYPPYSKYVSSFLYNTTYNNGYQPMQNHFSSNFTADLLKTIASQIKSKRFKNAYLKQTLFSHFNKKSTSEINSNEFEVFLALSSNEQDKALVHKLLRDNEQIATHHQMMNFKLHDFTNTSRSLKQLLRKKNSLLFFWSPNKVSRPYVQSRINYLSNRYPQIQFLTIQIDGDTHTQIENFDIKKQFFIKSNSEANSFLTSKMTRSILINRKGIVTNGFASLSSRNIYSQLDQLNQY
ncbi:hypothetical protein [Polaribacter sp. HL-MS24]|uniref:hypothetical protein n=1 Tax=Polaribacter sp. HL-MS24 TaxID=3077735 RepID=UPI002934147F|nr:hypothetical protein [Polaribacter sp. HL-MS24]WOC40270.1 hypothetical protein RRF69_00150 [Polaribacter sp. HL-MS24]